MEEAISAKARDNGLFFVVDDFLGGGASEIGYFACVAAFSLCPRFIARSRWASAKPSKRCFFLPLAF
ncbi:hypothetical protein V5279_23175 [Bradyrhizobium sp. 26S5]|uniref:hypothetical protein n=1 Tax=Bradyrhizobium sp. 26S5 TaxID=3139729 RepID=UPI0030CD36CE